MGKVFVVGAGTYQTAIETAKKILQLKEGVEIVCVESLEDIPLSERFKSDPSIIQQIHEIKAPPIIPVTSVYIDKKKKGHERPYKYHQ